MKAITPVIALVMLMLVTVGLVGISYTWFSGIFSSSTSKFISIPPGGAICSDGKITVFVLNNGDSTIITPDIIVAQVDGVDVLNTPFFGDKKTNLLGYWKLDEGSGTTATDSSGNGKNGNILGGPQWVNGRSRLALGIDDGTQTIDNADIDLGNDWTIEAWFPYPNNGVEESGHWRTLTRGGAGDHQVIVRNGGFELGSYDNAGGTGFHGCGYMINTLPSGWHHISAAQTGGITGKIEYYIDGNKVCEVINYGSTTDVRSIGNIWGGGQEWGVIDEVKIYNKAAGSASIQPGKSAVVIEYPGAVGTHVVRVGTKSNVAENSVKCT